ncbi:trypsin-4-like [Wyeomyia smithii]|uniref:trypsin-4-like n=1 Tax=Wyeomyia smithii TaxID=174621 RepID=UPI002467D0CE|nr:trypsin-4-like [Wyeomyia smithii]
MKQFTKVSLGCLFSYFLVVNSEDPSLEYLSSGRIVGGYNDFIEYTPYLVSIGIQPIGHICGGSIISASWVLTAAHCMTKMTPAILSVRAGSTYHNRGGEVRGVSRIISHENFDLYYKMDYDFALLQLSSPLIFGETVAAAPLADYTQSFYKNDMCKASGWGVEKSSGTEVPETIKSIDIPLVDQDTCRQQYQPKYVITQRMICAGAKGKDSCQGDSGGPLFCQGVLLGVVSFGIGCATDRHSGVYSNIPDVRNWIWKHTGV